MLYQKHRPTSLDEIVGNMATISALKTMIGSEEHPHTILLTGPSGCGKTTTARILAKEFGCHDNAIVELNTANFRGIEAAREIIRQTKFKPMSGTSKAWILNEMQRGTIDFQSTLLEILEDVPNYIYFLITTTDPQKLLKAVVNRCTQYTFQTLPEKQIVYLIEMVCEKENTLIPTSVKSLIARSCMGSPRQALTMLEKAFKMDERHQLRALQQSSTEDSDIIDLCRALVGKKKWNDVAKILRGLSKTDVETIRLGVMGYCSKVLLSKDDPRVFLIMDSFKDPFYNSGHAGLTRACYQALFD